LIITDQSDARVLEVRMAEQDPGPGLLPIVGWLRSYNRSWLRGDLIAGVTVAALIVPKNLGYAEIAGIPVQNGLYAAAAGAILYAIFGTCRQISMGPSSGLAAVAASAVFAAGITDQAEVAAFVAGITLASGALFLLLAVFKMGWIAQFLSRAVVTGFLFGAAIDVVIGELPKITGTKVEGSNSLREFFLWLGTLGDTQWLTLLVGGAALVVVFGLRIIAPRVPGALVLVVGGLLASWFFNLGDHGVALVGEVPRGLPHLELPNAPLLWDHAAIVAMAAVALMLIGFSQTAGDARGFAIKHHYQVDLNQESVAQALTNTGAGLFQGMPVSTSLSASSLNDHSGAKTGLASMISGVTVLLTLLVLAPLFSDLPKAVLAAVITEAVVMGMMNVPEMRRLARVQRFDFWVAITAILATLIFGVLTGVIIGIALSLLWLIAVTTRPNIAVLGREPGTQVYRDIAKHPDDEQLPGIAIVRLDGDLFFATADAFEDRIREIIHSSSELTALVLDCEGINFVDSQGSAKMAEIAQLAEESELTLRLARVKPAVAATLERDEVLERIPTEHIHGNVDRAVQAHLADRSGENRSEQTG
jgi:SulP family sulfate permease